MDFCGDRLATLREDKGWTQKLLAKKLNISVTTISEYENGRTNPSLPVLIEISEIFDISLDYLCGLSNQMLSYNHDNCIAIPKNCSIVIKDEINHQVDLVKKYYDIK